MKTLPDALKPGNLKMRGKLTKVVAELVATNFMWTLRVKEADSEIRQYRNTHE
jgi:hypothetical protein